MNHRLLSALLCALFAGAPLAAQQALDEVAGLWRDPEFQRQFVAGYGVNAEIEPRVTPDEVELLEELRPLMGTDLVEAEAALRKKLKPNSSAMLDFTLGGILFQQDRMDEAFASFQKAVAKFPSFRRAWRNLGLIHVQAGRYEEAIRTFTRMIELGGADGYAFGLLGVAYAAGEDFQAAESAFRNALLLQPDYTEWRMRLAMCVYRQEKFEDAAALLDSLITRFPDNNEFWILQARTFLSMGRSLQAAEVLESVFLLGNASTDHLFLLGDIYVTESLLDLAARAYLRALDSDPAQAPERALRAAEALLGRGGVDPARLVTQRLRGAWEARLSDPERRRLLKLDARIRMAAGAGGPETAQVLEEIVQLDPLDGEALMLLGEHYAGAGERERAILYYERAANIETYTARANYLHGDLLVKMGRYDDALPILRRSQEVAQREDIARYIEQVERAARAARR